MVKIEKWAFATCSLLFLAVSTACCLFIILLGHTNNLTRQQNQVIESQNELLNNIQRQRLEPQIVRMPKGYIFMYDPRAYEFPKNAKLFMLENGKPFPIPSFQNDQWSIAFLVPNEHMSMRYKLITDGKERTTRPPSDAEI